MKKTINGVRFDTAKSILISYAISHRSPASMHYWYEMLYMTPRSKKFFLVGTGGTLTCWKGKAEPRLKPISYATALQWVRENGRAETIKKYFDA